MERELWVVTGSDPVTWAVPFWSERDRRGTTQLSCAMSLTKYQFEALTLRMGKSLTGFSVPSRWKMSGNHLRSIGHRITEPKDLLNPEEHFIWERARNRDLKPRPLRARRDRDDFLVPMYARGFGKSLDEIEYWWNQFANQMIWHLLNKETPVDLYFCKLHPSPYRMGWARPLKQLTSEQLLDPRRLAWDGRACLRSIDLEFTRTWWKLARMIEHERVSMLGKKLYAAEYMGWVERRIEQSIRIQRQWMEHRRRALAKFRQSDSSGVVIFDGYSGTVKTSKRADQSLARPDKQSQERKKQEQKQRADSTHRHMQHMRDSRRRNLRQARRVLYRTANGPTGDDGMLVPDQPDLKPTESGVLA